MEMSAKRECCTSEFYEVFKYSKCCCTFTDDGSTFPAAYKEKFLEKTQSLWTCECPYGFKC